MTLQTETRRAGEFILSEANGYRSRKNIVIGASQTLLAGAVLGAVLLGTPTVAAKAGGNTGGGSLTLDPTTPLLAGAQQGVYTVRNIGDIYDGTIAAVAGNTGNGTAAMHTTETAEGVIEGVYKAVFLEPATDLGRFAVEDPNGVIIGQGIVGTLFNGVVKFTISDGATDFAAGDAFTITVAKAVATNLGLFRVTDPSGNVLGTIAPAAAAFASEIKFTIADSGTDFAIGDGFDITVPAGTGVSTDTERHVVHDPEGVDGRQVACAILFDAVTTGVGETARAVGIVADAEVKLDYLDWDDHTDGEKTTALAELAALGIIARS